MPEKKQCWGLNQACTAVAEMGTYEHTYTQRNLSTQAVPPS